MSDNEEFIGLPTSIPNTQKQRIISFITEVLGGSEVFPSFSVEPYDGNKLLFRLRDNEGLFHTCEMKISISEDGETFGVAFDGCSRDDCDRIGELRTNLLLHFMTEDPFSHSLSPPPKDKDDGYLYKLWDTALDQYNNLKWDDCFAEPWDSSGANY